MSLFYKQNAAARFFVDQTNGKVYEVVGGSAALLCWRNGVKEREKVAGWLSVAPLTRVLLSYPL